MIGLICFESRTIDYDGVRLKWGDKVYIAIPYFLVTVIPGPGDVPSLLSE